MGICIGYWHRHVFVVAIGLTYIMQIPLGQCLVVPIERAWTMAVLLPVDRISPNWKLEVDKGGHACVWLIFGYVIRIRAFPLNPRPQSDSCGVRLELTCHSCHESLLTEALHPEQQP